MGGYIKTINNNSFRLLKELHFIEQFAVVKATVVIKSIQNIKFNIILCKGNFVKVKCTENRASWLYIFRSGNKLSGPVKIRSLLDRMSSNFSKSFANTELLFI